MDKMDEIRAIKQFLDSHKVHTSSEWLEHCITWCKEEALSHNHTIKDLKEKVFEQWLLLDLRDIEVPCLPPNLSSQQRYLLTGIYFLQIMEIVDIAKPKYWQIQNIRNATPKNLDQENLNSKRVLMLTLTDGAQEVKAVELRPIQALNLNLHPGIKIKIIGPIMIRHGRLMLEQGNVKVIGGEVDTLLVSNAAENVIARCLNLPINPNPIRVQEMTIEQLNTDLSHQTNSVNQITDRTISKKQEIKTNPMLSNKSLNRIGLNQSISNIHSNDQCNDLINFIEEHKISQHIELTVGSETEINNPFKMSKESRSRRTPDMFDDMDVDDYNFETIELPDISTTNSEVNQRPFNKNNKSDNLIENLEIGNDVLEKMAVNIDTNIKKPVNNITKEHVSNQPVSSNILPLNESLKHFFFEKDFKNVEKQKQIKSSNEAKVNIWTIQELNKILPNINTGNFKIKAKYKSVIEKLVVVDEKFHLIVEVEDDSGSIVLKLNNEVVSDLARCSALELIGSKAQAQENILEAQRKVIGVLETLKENLLKLNNIVDIQIDAKEKYPHLLKISDIC